MRSSGWWLGLAMIAACETEPDEAPPADEPGVMKDCPAEVGNICPFAGAGSNGYNGEGNDRHETLFSFPMSATFSPYGPVAIADWNNHKIRVLADDGTITTVMGTGFLGDGDPMSLDKSPGGAPGTSVNLNHPTMQQYWPDGTMLSASWHTHKLRTWDPTTGSVHVVMGGMAGFAPAEIAEDRGAPMPDSGCLLNQPKSIEIAADGTVFILDMRNERIRHWDPVNGTIRTIAGSGAKGVVGTDCQDGDALTTCFNFPKDANPEPGGAMAISPDGEMMYIADSESHVIRAFDLVAGTVTTIAGGAGTRGLVDGPGADARFSLPTDVELDGDTLFVADADNHAIRAIDLTTGVVSTIAGTGEPTCPHEGDVAIAVVCDEQLAAGDGGPAVDATLYRPFGVDLDLDGNLVVADSYNHRFRIIYR